MGRRYNHDHNLSRNRNKVTAWGRLARLLDLHLDNGLPSNLRSLCQVMVMRPETSLSHKHGLPHDHQFKLHSILPITRTIRTIRQFPLIILERWFPGLVGI